MSNLNIFLSIDFSKGGAKLKRKLHKSISITGNVCHQSVQVIGDPEEAVTFPSDIGTIGFVILHNLSDTDRISVGRTPGVYTMKISPGSFCLFELFSGTTFYALADTGNCDMEKIIIEV